MQKKPGWVVPSKNAQAFVKAGYFNTHPQFLRMPDSVPTVHLTPLALRKIHLMVSLISMEVGWLGVAYKNGNVITITDVYLFEQDVSFGHTEISSDSLATFMTEVLGQPEGEEIFNNIRFWGHSHGTGGVLPSQQDDDTMKIFGEFGADFFVRGIFNRVGSLRFSVYDWERGLAFHEVPWTYDLGDYSKSKLRRLRTEVLEEMQRKVIHHPPPRPPAIVTNILRPFGFALPQVAVVPLQGDQSD